MLGGCARHRGVTGGIVGDPKLPRWGRGGRFGGHFRGMGVCPPVQKGVRLGRSRPARQGRIHWAGRIECGCRKVLEWQTAAGAAVCVFSVLILKGVILETAAIAAVLCVVSSSPR